MLDSHDSSIFIVCDVDLSFAMHSIIYIFEWLLVRQAVNVFFAIKPPLSCLFDHVLPEGARSVGLVTPAAPLRS
jgi:hypothetical protein